MDRILLAHPVYAYGDCMTAATIESTVGASQWLEHSSSLLYFYNVHNV